MVEIYVESFGVTVEITFPKPRNLVTTQPELVATTNRYAELLPAPRGDLREVALASDKAPFNYTLTAPLFSQSGALRVNAFSATATIRNGRTHDDGDAIVSTLKTVIDVVRPPEGSKFHCFSYIDCKVPATKEAEGLFRHTIGTTKMEGFGLSGVVRVENWAAPVKVGYEPSVSITGGLFARFETDFDGTQLEKIADAFAAAARLIGLEIQLLPRLPK